MAERRTSADDSAAHAPQRPAPAQEVSVGRIKPSASRGPMPAVNSDAGSADPARRSPVKGVPVAVKSKLSASRSNLKALSDTGDQDSRQVRKKVRRAAEPLEDKETDKLIRHIWRNAVNESTLPGKTIKSLRTAFARASPSEAGPSGSVQPFAEAFPTAELGGYTIGDEIGRGGMGVVYKAYQASLQRDVAIKLLLPEMAADPEHAAKFISEALVNAELSHPNIMPVYEIGQTSDGRKYIVMKLVIGISWWSILHPFTEAEKDVAAKLELGDHLDLLLHMCDAVAYAHSRSIIHRDIKPDNLLVGKYGEVLLMDWGVAADLRPNLTADAYKAEPLSAINHPSGTPHYMAPEMARVEVQHIGCATDIYLLGATLYEILTGRPPHQAKETMDILIEAARNTVLEREEPNVNRELMRIAKRAMATVPQDRYGTVEDFARAVREFRKHAESLRIKDNAYESLTIARNSRGARAYQYYSEALGGFTQALQLWPDNEDAVAGRFATISQHTELALSSGDLALAESLLSQWKSYSRHLASEYKKREDQNIAELSSQLIENRRQIKARKSTLAAARFVAATLLAIVVLGGGIGMVVLQNSLSDAVELRKKSDAAKENAEAALRKAETAEMEAVQSAAEIRMQTDLAQAASRKLEKALELMQQEKQKAVEETAKARESLAQAYASQADTRQQEKNFSSARLLYARSLQLNENEHARQGLIQVGRPRILWNFLPAHPADSKPERTIGCRYSPDGQWLYLGMQGGATNLYCLNAQTGSIQWTATKLAAPSAICRRMDLSRDGRVLTLIFHDPNTGAGTVVAVDPRDGSLAHLYPVSHGLYYAGLSPDGSLLVGSNEDGLLLMQLDTGATVWTNRETADRSSPCGFSADGKRIYIARNGSSLGVLDLEGKPVDGDWSYRAQSRNLRAMAVSPDGSRLLLAGREGDLGVYQIEPFQLLHFETLHDSEALSIDPGASNLLAASGAQTGEVLVWRQENERVAARFRLSSQPIYGVALSPNEKFVAMAGYDGQLRVASLDLEQPRRVLSGPASEPARLGMTVSADGATVYLANWVDRAGAVGLEAVSLETGARRWTAPTLAHPLQEAPAQIAALRLSADGKCLAVGDHAGDVRLFNAATGEKMAERRFNDAVVADLLDLGFGPEDKELLILVAGTDDRRLRRLVLWDWQQDTLRNQQDHTFDDQPGRVLWLSSQKRWFIGAFGNSFTLDSDLDNRQKVQHWGNPAVCLSPDGKQLAGMYEDQGICLMSGPRCQANQLFAQSDHQIEPALDFSSDGAFLAAGTRDGNLLIWHTTRSELLVKMPLGARNCEFVRWIPNRRALLIAGAGRAPLAVYDLSALEGSGDDHMRAAQIDLRRKVSGFLTTDMTAGEYRELVEGK